MACTSASNSSSRWSDTLPSSSCLGGPHSSCSTLLAEAPPSHAPLSPSPTLHRFHVTAYAAPREEIYDLLRPNSGSLNLREDIRKGVYVEGLVEKVVDNSECCLLLKDWILSSFEGFTRCLRLVEKVVDNHLP
jgi:hypothetical protein